MSTMDDTIARYDPVEALLQISELTGFDLKTVAQVLEAEMDYLGCLGLLDERELDAAAAMEISNLKQENADLVEDSDGEYDLGSAASFIQRNRGVDRDTILKILAANHQFMDERGFLSEEWGDE